MGGVNYKIWQKRGEESYLNRYLIGWSVAAMVIAADWIWVSVCGYSVEEKGVVALMWAAAISMATAVFLFGVAHISRYTLLTDTLRCRQIACTLAWLTLLLSFVAAYDLLQYLCATLNEPLIDQSLLEFDSALGFHWLQVYLWVRSHPAVQHILGVAYGSIFMQGLAVPAILGLTGRREELSEFVFLFMLSGILLLLISTPIPASSAFLHFGISDPYTSSSVSDFYSLRNGTLRVFEMVPLEGMVSMPSFHTTLAILFIYALRRMRYLLLFSIPLNVTMILSTPTQGGHYLADVFAGLLLSALTISTLRSSSRLMSNHISEDASKGAVRDGI